MRSRWFGLVVAALAAAVSVWAYPRLPETVATHWNLQGMPDGYSSRFWAVAVMPLLTLGLWGLFNVLPKVDPRRENYAKFLDSYWLIANAVLVFTGVADALILANGLGYTVQVDRLVPLRNALVGNLGMFLHMLPTLYFGAAAVHMTRMAGTGHTQWERYSILGLLSLGVVVWLVLWLTRGRQP